MEKDAAIFIRKAGLADVTVIVAMLADDALGAQREDTRFPLRDEYRNAFAAIDADPNQLLAVVERDREIIGCMQISFIPGLSRLGLWRGQIESVRIASTVRGVASAVK